MIWRHGGVSANYDHQFAFLRTKLLAFPGKLTGLQMNRDACILVDRLRISRTNLRVKASNITCSNSHEKWHVSIPKCGQSHANLKVNMPKWGQPHAKWKLNTPTCSKPHAKWKVTMPKCGKYHTKWKVNTPTRRKPHPKKWTYPNAANTMPNDKFKSHFANTRQTVPAKQSPKKS